MEIPEKGPRLRLRLKETQPTKYCRERKGGRDAGLTSLGVPARDIRRWLPILLRTRPTFRNLADLSGGDTEGPLTNEIVSNK